MKKTVFLLAMLIAQMGVSSPLPVENFSKQLEYHDVVISPDGKHIAVQRSAEEGKQLVAIIETDTMKLKSHIPATTSESPINPHWISNEKIIVGFTESFDSGEYEFANGELLTMNADGKIRRKIVAHKVFVTSGKIKRLNDLHGWARVAHMLPEEKKKLLIEFYEAGYTRTGFKPKLYKIGASNGKLKLITEAPSYNARFTFSPDGKPQYALGLETASIKKANNYIAHQFKDKKWQPVGRINIDAVDFYVVGVTTNPEEIYIQAEYMDKPDKIYRYNMATGDKELVFHHPKVNPTKLDVDKVSGELIAVHFDDGYPDIHIVDPDHIYSKWYPALYQAAGGKRVRITSSTKDGSRLIVHMSGDTEPGQFHLFNTTTKKINYLFNAASWINSETLASVKPIEFSARDGLVIHGYLTLPTDAQGESPLVVLPHGGPHGPRDKWKYNSEVQFLASRGYAVLQVNFRGSGGYGLGFEKAGYKKWGAEIQYDIIDGTRWAASLESIDENKICIMGGSFGGYSALMSPTIEPDLYKCAIGLVGVYDLNLMWSTADIKRLQSGKNYLDEVIGQDKKILRDFSPLHNLTKLKAPVFLAHGGKDWRVDEKHFHAMKKSLDNKGHPAEYLFVKKEGHGFYNEKNRVAYLSRVESFLGKYISPD